MNSPSRRQFLRDSILLTGGAYLSGCQFPYVSRRRVLGANERLRIAAVGVGGKGWTDVTQAGATENIVGICDVDSGRLAQAGKTFTSARRFADWREMFDQLGNQIDAVTVSTPDHTHFPPSMRAVQHGWHVYCQKPLTHTIWEARELTRATRAAGVATQMGNQGMSRAAVRRDAEWVKAGVLGTVREIHCWTDRPGPWWPQGVQRPTDRPTVPKELSWDLWLGTAPERPYHPAWGHFKWRGWWDFGTGAVGDMGCHLLNVPTLSMDLSNPSAVEATSEGANDETAPVRSHVVWDIPARRGQAALRFHWYDGGSLPPTHLFPGQTYGGNGVLMVGSEDTLLTSYESLPGGGKLRSGRTAADLKSVPEKFEKYADSEGAHYQEWIRACKGGPKAQSAFDVAGPVTETLLLGNLAIRAGQRLEWDSKALKIRNLPSANQWVKTQYRPGFVG